MAKKKSNQKRSGPTEPRLRSFLRKAEAIIAAEKGLNAESRLKLQTLADHLKLPPSLLEEALAQLQEGADPTSKLTHYEKAFIKFLDTQLEKIAGDIVSPRAENQAIAMAHKRFGINSTRAEQLIAARTEAAGMSLISSLEAETFADLMIVDRIGGQTLIDDELYDEVYKIGRKWGLSQAQVDRVVDREVSRNKASQKPGFRKLVVSILAFTVVAAVFVGWAFVAGWVPDRWLNQPEMTNALDDRRDSATDTDPSSRFPATISSRLDGLRLSNATLGPTLDDISGVDPSRRRSGYQQLIQAASSGGNSDRLALLDLTRELFYSDPDEDSALAILSAIEQLLAVNPNNPPSVQNMKNAFEMNKLLGQLKFNESMDDPSSKTRTDAVDTAIETLLDRSVDDVETVEDYLAISERAIATDQWNQVMRAAWSSPTQAAVLLQPLFDLTLPKLEAEALNAYRDDTLVSIMETDPSRWRVLQTQIRRSLPSCDEAKLLEWISIFEASNDGALRDLLAELMLPRIDVRPASQSREDIASAIKQFGLKTQNRVLSSVIVRDELLDKFFTNTIELEAGNSGKGISPDRIAQVASAVNVEWAFCAALENATHIDDSSFSEFDRLISLPSPRLRQLISLPIDRRTKKTTGPATATASDRRRMSASLERLRDVEPGSSRLRVGAVKQLKQIAHRIERISYTEASILASYFLSNLEVEELLNAEQMIESFAQWPNLPLAIADQLPDSDVETDQILTILRLLLNRNLELESTSDWKSDLQVKILAAVSNNVENQVDQDPNNVKSNWIRLKIYLAETYRLRLTLNSTLGYTNEAYPAPHQAAALLVESLADAPNPNGNANLKQAIRLVHTSTANEVEKTAFANQLLIQTMVNGLSNTSVSNEATQLLRELGNRLQGPRLAGDRLYATELTLLQVINLKRTSLVRQLLQQDKKP